LGYTLGGFCSSPHPVTVSLASILDFVRRQNEVHRPGLIQHLLPTDFQSTRDVTFGGTDSMKSCLPTLQVVKKHLLKWKFKFISNYEEIF
jgi:hypothetical protein